MARVDLKLLSTKLFRLPGCRWNFPESGLQALALSPDGRLLVTSGQTNQLIVIDSFSGQILQRVPLPDAGKNQPERSVSDAVLVPDLGAQLSFTGLAFSPDGSRIYLANVNGDVKVFKVQPDREVEGFFSIPLPPANTSSRKSEIPAGIAVSSDGKRLYVVLNLSNRLAELDAATGRVLRTWDVGVEPFDVVVGPLEGVCEQLGRTQTG